MTRPKKVLAGALGVVLLGVAGLLLWLGLGARKNPVEKTLDEWRSLPQNHATFKALVDLLAKPENKAHLRKVAKTEKSDFLLAAAVEAIRKLDDREASGALIERFRTFRESREGGFAGQNMAALLADWKTEAAIEPLLENADYYCLHGGDVPLARMGPGAIRKVIEVAGSKDDPRRDRAIEIISRVRDPAARDALIEALRTGRPQLRQCAAIALGNYPNDTGVEQALVEAAEGSDASLAPVATGSLLRLDAAKHRLRVFPLLRSRDEFQIIAGCRLAGTHHISEAAPTMRKLLAYEIEPVQYAAAAALSDLGMTLVTKEPQSDGSWVVILTGEVRATLRFRDSAITSELERGRRK